MVSGVLPAGYTRPATQDEWRAHLRDVLDAQPIRDDRRETVAAVALAVMCWADWDTVASRPGWAELIDRCRQATGRGSRRTIARHLAYLIDLKLIARVASGRRGCHAPGGCQATERDWKKASACLTPGCCPPDEAAVYVLLVPSPLRAVAAEDASPVLEREASLLVDGLGTPPTPSVVSSLPVRARNENILYEPLRGTVSQAAQAPLLPRRWSRTVRPWPGHATTRSPDDRLLAAAELQERLPVLRQISTRDVRFCLKEFFTAGWTVSDVHHALDWRPDGTRWPHSGTRGIGPTSVRGWIAHRLAPWTADGDPRRSFSQRGAAELTERRARQQAERDRYAAERANATPPTPELHAQMHAGRRRLADVQPIRPSAVDALPQIRARLAEERRARAERAAIADQAAAAAAEEEASDELRRREREAIRRRAIARAKAEREAADHDPTARTTQAAT